jgi:hypothetical protein
MNRCLIAAALAVAAMPAAADRCALPGGQSPLVPELPAVQLTSVPQGGCVPPAVLLAESDVCRTDEGDPLMVWDASGPRCLTAAELVERARSACAADYESASLAHIDEAWPALAVRQYAAGNPPGPRVACYAADLARVDAALSAAVADMDGLTAEQMDPCPTVVWPEMRYYTDADLSAGAEPCAD